MAKDDGVLDFVEFSIVGFEKHKEAFNKLIDSSNSLPDNKIVGGVIKFPVADGYAYYLVTKARPLTVKRIPFMDDWSVHPALIRGLNKQDIIKQLIYNKKVSKLFHSN